MKNYLSIRQLLPMEGVEIKLKSTKINGSVRVGNGQNH